MRNIRFRAWDKANLAMIPSDYNDDDYIWSFEGGKIVLLERCFDGAEQRDYFENADIEIMQYTGLKDKNGVEIYEGDIVEINYIDAVIGECIFDGGGYELRGLVCDGNYHMSCEDNRTVLGNIHQNPELLES